jgi:hypothetical protein
MRAVSGFYRDRAAADGIIGGRTGAVNRIQRFGSSLNLNVHFHALLLDGVYTAASPLARPVFHAAGDLEDAEVAAVVERIRTRVLRLLRRRGYLRDEGDGGDEGRISLTEDHEEQGLLSLFQAASIQGLVAQGPDAGARLVRVGRLGASGVSSVPSPLCAEVDGFSLHAAVRISSSDRERLEHLCRYIARPPLAADRLTLAARGRVRYEYRRPWRDGTTHVEFEPLVFLERLAALVPPPRMHLQTYHGVLAPGSTWRDDVVPVPVPLAMGEGTRSKSCSGREEGPGGSTRPRHRYLWAELMRRVFGVDVLRCGVCHSLRRLIAVITQRHVIIKILAHLGLETDPPPMQPARAPPQLELAF